MNKLLVSGVVFDWDATLANIGGYIRWDEAQKEIVECYLKCGCRNEDLIECSSKGVFNFINEIEKRMNGFNNKNIIDVRDVVYRILDRYESEVEGKGVFLPDVVEVLNLLHENNIKIGICTSNSTEITKKMIIRLKMNYLFSSIVGRSMYLRLKPYPDQISRCFEEMKIDPVDGVVIGDSPNDVIAGKAVGSKTIAIPYYFTNREALVKVNPDFIISSIKDLPEILGFR